MHGAGSLVKHCHDDAIYTVHPDVCQEVVSGLFLHVNV